MCESFCHYFFPWNSTENKMCGWTDFCRFPKSRAQCDDGGPDCVVDVAGLYTLTRFLRCSSGLKESTCSDEIDVGVALKFSLFSITFRPSTLAIDISEIISEEKARALGRGMRRAEAAARLKSILSNQCKNAVCIERNSHREAAP